VRGGAEARLPRPEAVVVVLFHPVAEHEDKHITRSELQRDACLVFVLEEERARRR